MCVYSMVTDHYWAKWRQPPYQPEKNPQIPEWYMPVKPITQEEIDEFRRLLERAREYDRLHNEPSCELKEKQERLLKLAAELGIDIAFIKESHSAEKG